VNPTPVSAAAEGSLQAVAQFENISNALNKLCDGCRECCAASLHAVVQHDPESIPCSKFRHKAPVCGPGLSHVHGEKKRGDSVKHLRSFSAAADAWQMHRHMTDAAQAQVQRCILRPK
jgi:hypothetical protein